MRARAVAAVEAEAVAPAEAAEDVRGVVRGYRFRCRVEGSWVPAPGTAVRQVGGSGAVLRRCLRGQLSRRTEHGEGAARAPEDRDEERQAVAPVRSGEGFG